MKQAFRLTPVIAALGVAAGLAFSAGAQAQTIKIAVVGPTTGPVTQLPSTGAGDDHTNQSVLAIAAIVSLFLMVVAAASSRTHRRQRW